MYRRSIKYQTQSNAEHFHEMNANNGMEAGSEYMLHRLPMTLANCMPFIHSSFYLHNLYLYLSRKSRMTIMNSQSNVPFVRRYSSQERASNPPLSITMHTKMYRHFWFQIWNFFFSAEFIARIASRFKRLQRRWRRRQWRLQTTIK